MTRPSATRSGGCLAICHKQLGDLILLEPALSKLSCAFDGRLALVTRSGHQDLVSLMSNVRPARTTTFRRFDAVVAFDAGGRSAWKAALALGARKFLVSHDAREISPAARLIFSRILAPGFGEEFAARYYWRHAPIGDAPYRPPQLLKPPDDWCPPRAPHARRYILLNPTAGWKSKRWSPKGWADAARSITEAHPDLQVVISGGTQPWQIDHCNRVANRLGSSAVNFVGRTTARDYLWLTANAAMVLSVDGSASHLASAFGQPSVTVFVRENASTWHESSEISVALQFDRAEDEATRNDHADELASSALALLSRVSG